MDERVYICPRCPSTSFRRRVHLNVIEWQRVDEYADVHDVIDHETDLEPQEVYRIECDGCDYAGPEIDFQQHLEGEDDGNHPRCA